MTALRKFLPSETDWSEVAKAHRVFIHALNAPIPLDVLSVMRMEDHLRGTAFGFRLLPQTLCERASKTVTAPRTGGAT